MRRFLAVLLIPVVVAAVAPAAPVPKHLMKQPVYYFPTTVGAKRVYEGNGREQVLVVSKVEDNKGAKVVTVEEEGANGRVANEVMEMSESGLARLGLGGTSFDAPLAMLQAPFRVGTTWKLKAAGVEGTNTITAVETIKVPAGAFEAIRVDSDYTLAGQKRSCSFWYAPGIGLVKTMWDGKENVLKSFVPGK
ncbi:TapB family protein [Frigoriglobus tundricola]|uniref:DUF3108 domain-containing protein n=1 Tax=Frigoriglobus tundricola TaxID=2774151 RepID=A0A6M5YUN4_9BACT|nr:hypothetical protein [Frigoriglobus tundricola]QJW97110.1 hypothetical protein FTUN_4675 [Frigoriglobus tundricola]